MSSDISKDQKLKALIAGALGQSLKDPIYLASGFFTDQQRETLTEFETLLGKQGKNFYSPRNHSVNFADSKNKAAVIEEIFNSNVENIDESTSAHFFLDTSNRGQYDIGTVWELGYAVGSYMLAGKNLTKLKLHLANDGTEWVFEQIKENLEKISFELAVPAVDQLDKSASMLICKDNAVGVADTIETLGYNMSFYNVNSLLADYAKLAKAIKSSKSPVVLIDNNPYQSIALMGMLYAHGIAYRTASIKGYGSNVMIAASSKGHIQLPGFYDEKKTQKTID